MIKLIRTDISRLWKTTSFWLCGGIMIAVMLVNFLFDHSITPPSSSGAVFGCRMVGGGIYVICFAAVFVSLFIGADYANGTIRNKLSVGHGRCAVYFSNLIVSSVGCLIYCAAFWSAQMAVGFAGGWSIGMETSELIGNLAVSLLAVISACSLFTLVGMLITTKSSSAVITIVGTVGLFMIMSLLVDLLSRADKDSMYIESPLRDLLAVVCGALPFGQAVELVFVMLHDLAVLPLYSVGLTALISVIGSTAFRRKDLK